MFQKTTAFRIFFWASLILIGFFIFFPLLWLINTALKPTSETFSSYFFVGPLTLDNIIHIVTDPKIMGYLKNSLIVSFGSSLMATIVCAFAGWYVRRVNLHSLFTRATSQSPYKNSSEEQYESQLESQI